MITLTPKAKEILEKEFAEKKREPLRIFLECDNNGTRLGLAMDRPGATDQVVEADGFEFVVDKALAITGAPFTVDFSQCRGFDVSSSLRTGSGECGSCSSCSSCSGC
jgi:Fe-S cluster assembly iron-binding protein IscA